MVLKKASYQYDDQIPITMLYSWMTYQNFFLNGTVCCVHQFQELCKVSRKQSKQTHVMLCTKWNQIALNQSQSLNDNFTHKKNQNGAFFL